MSAPLFPSRSISAQTIRIEPTFAAWREAARPLLQQAVPPEAVNFTDTDTPSATSLFAPEPQATQSTTLLRPHVPQAFLHRAETVACHRSPARWNILYRLLWRLQTNRNLLLITVDDDMAAFRRLEQQVHRDLHKMHAFVRFRRIAIADEAAPDGEAYIAWYEPAHLILPLAAPFFAERFAIMRWSILTPDGCIHWNPKQPGSPKQVIFTPGVSKEMAPQADELEDLWLTYYGSIFNPARTNLRAMRSEMPMRFWKNLPEMQIMPNLLAQAGERVATMIERQSTLNAASWVPKEHTLPILREAIPGCQGCELY